MHLLLPLMFVILQAPSPPRNVRIVTVDPLYANTPQPLVPFSLGKSTHNCIDVDGDGYGVGDRQRGPYTDLAISAADTRRVTSASHPWALDDVSFTLMINGGSGFVPQTTNIERIVPTGSVDTVSLLAGGSGYTPGTYRVSIAGSPAQSAAQRGWVYVTVAPLTANPAGAITSIGPIWAAGTTNVTPGDGGLSGYYGGNFAGGSGYDVNANRTTTAFDLSGVGTGSGAALSYTVNLGPPIAVLASAAGTAGSTGGTFVEPGCLGPDADDTDATVHTADQAIAKWGTLAAFWTHLGFSITQVLYVGDAGSCGKVQPPFTYDATKACATMDAAIAAQSPGDAVVIRGGTYARAANAPLNFKPGSVSGQACTATTYYLAYPGELPEFTFVDGQVMQVAGAPQSCYTVDGLKFRQLTPGLGRGFSVGLEMPMYGWTLSHLDLSGFNDGIFPQYSLSGLRITQNYIHDIFDNAGLDGHGIYIGSRVTTGFSGNLVQGNIIARVVDSSLHMNGPMSQTLVDGNLIYGGAKALALQSGVNHTTFSNNVIHTISGRIVEFDVYANQYASNTFQCHDQNYNVFKNNTFVATSASYDSAKAAEPSAGSSLIYVVEDKSNGGCIQQAGVLPDQGHNTYVNNIIVANCATLCETGANGTPNPANGGPLLRYAGTAAATWFGSDTYLNNVLYNANVATAILNIRSDVSVFGTTLDCSGFQAGSSAISGNLCNSDPQFVSFNPRWWTNAGRFNLRPQATSPAVGAALPSQSPRYDFTGTARLVLSAIGAYEVVHQP